MFRVAARREGGRVRTARAIRLGAICVVFWWWVLVEMVGFGGEVVGGRWGVGWYNVLQ